MNDADQIVKKIIEVFKSYVKRGLFKIEFISGKREYYAGGRCHSRVLGMLINAFQEMQYTTDVERAVEFKLPYKPRGRERTMHQYRPDITIVDDQDRIVGIVEYETIDATEEHLHKKIDHFDHSIPAHSPLRFITFLTTLTTLSRKPQSWVETERKKYAKPLQEMLRKLSKKYPEVYVIFGILDEEGLYFAVIKEGITINTYKENIWKIQTAPANSNLF